MLEVKLEVGVILGPDPEHLTSRTDPTRWGLLRLFISHSRPCRVGAAKGKTETQAPPESNGGVYS